MKFKLETRVTLGNVERRARQALDALLSSMPLLLPPPIINPVNSNFNYSTNSAITAHVFSPTEEHLAVSIHAGNVYIVEVKLGKATLCVATYTQYNHPTGPRTPAKISEEIYNKNSPPSALNLIHPLSAMCMFDLRATRFEPDHF